jgi:phage-related minor tail protein
LTPKTSGLEIGRDRKTVLAHLQKPGNPEQVADIHSRLADKFEQMSERILDAVCDADLEKASLQQKAISAGVMLDKSRLLRGQATSHVAVMFAAIEAACSDTGDG